MLYGGFHIEPQVLAIYLPIYVPSLTQLTGYLTPASRGTDFQDASDGVVWRFALESM